MSPREANLTGYHRFNDEGGSVHQAHLLDTCDFYSRISLWPSIPQDAKPEAWLANFHPSEQDVAQQLLRSFVFINARMTDKLFTSSFHGISPSVSVGSDYSIKRTSWRQFLERCLLTYPTGELPNVTDSGFAFCRKARQLIEINEDQILSPADALSQADIISGRPIVFVDDFVGSGDQFLTTWRRQYKLSNGTSTSFQQLAASGSRRIFYVSTVCTMAARHRINLEAPSVELHAAHFLPNRYSAKHPDTLLVASSMRPTVLPVIRAATIRAGLPVEAALGHEQLGLAIAFEHCVPDATLPIFWTDNERWTALLRRV